MNDNQKLDLANVPQELKVILKLLRTSNVNDELYSDIDWDLFIQQVIHHRVFPLVYPLFKKYDGGVIPKQIIEQLSYLYIQNTFKMLFLTAEMENISRFFTEAKMPLIFLKGPIIAHELYGDVSFRTSSDLDFIIPIEHLTRAEEILVNIGYVKDDYFKSVLNDWKWRHHHVTFFHPQKKLKIEIHWRLHPGPGVEPKFQELWSRRVKSKLTSYPVYMLGKEDLFVFLVVHGARHGWSRIRWLFDIHRLAEQSVDWIEVNKLLRKYQSYNAGAQALILSSKLFNTKIKEPMKALIKNKRAKALAQDAIFYLERMVNLHTDPVPKEVFSYHSHHLFSLMTKRQKLMYILSIVHPFAEDAEVFPLPKLFHFLYFPLRPFIVFWRKKRKHVIS
ncbi:nucleotidyltransferase domain-containing protein [Metabacillus litoralis]|uniref:nucleotidyltransferase domain-containing protein n=1 Tax=Metabacillus litoralis TaxID=152268 RepID=UPI002040F667|nr:nucleotidyltransferase family protein [Metabacillus litoralis]MCM3412450.1 nucleotidyltransferase family protein [Metabacillus litoralis]